MKKILTTLWLLSIVTILNSQSIHSNFWMPNGEVYSMQQKDNLLYLGGKFNYIGPHTGTLAAIDDRTGQTIKDFPVFNGPVRTIVSDNKGGWYVGGAFTMVNDIPKNYIVHILPNYEIDLHWNFTIAAGTGYMINSIVVNNNIAYIGGVFVKINGVVRKYLAAFDTNTGDLLSWNPEPNLKVNVMMIREDSMIVGGSFTSIGGKIQSALASLKLTTGLATSWSPKVRGGKVLDVRALGMDQDYLFIGGKFDSLNNFRRQNLGAYNVHTGQLHSWRADVDVKLNGYVNSLVVTNSRVYIGGNFNTVNGTTITRFNDVGAIDKSTGNLIASFNPKVRNSKLTLDEVNYITLREEKLVIAGTFTEVGATRRLRVASIDTVSGVASAWDARASGQVFTVGFINDKTFIGGAFNSIGGVERTNLAAVDPTTGIPNSWSPYSNGFVSSIDIKDTLMFVGGKFDTLGTRRTINLGAISIATSRVMGWDVNTSAQVRAVKIDDNILYVGGLFTTVNKVNRKFIAAINIQTGTLTPWECSVDKQVNAISLTTNSLYIGGAFFYVGGQRRNGLAEVTKATGSVTDFDPNIGGYVNVIKTKDNSLYIGGRFDSVGNVLGYNAICEVDKSSGAPNPAYLNTAKNVGIVNAIEIIDTTLVVGGSFTFMGGIARSHLAAIGIRKAVGFPWRPTPNQIIHSLTGINRNLYAGGIYTAITGKNYSYLTQFNFNNTNSLVLAPTYLSYTSVGGRLTVKVESNASWTAEVDQPWITLNVSSGTNNGSVIFTATSNRGVARTANITFRSGNFSEVVKVVQAGIRPELTLSKYESEIPWEGGDVNVDIASNTNWSLSTDQPWVKARVTQGFGNLAIVLTCESNSRQQRNATVTFIAGNVLRTLTITQPEGFYTLDLSTDNLSYPKEESSQTIEVTSNSTWTVTTSEAWLILSTQYGENNGAVTIKAMANDGIARTGKITFVSQTLIRIVEVSQSGLLPVLQISKSSLSFNNKAADSTVNVISDDSWTVSADQPWISLNINGGENNGAVKVMLPDNLGDERFGTVTFTSGSVSKTLTVTQAKLPNLSLSSTRLEYNSHGGSQVIEVTSNTTWEVYNSYTWISLNVMGGTNNGRLIITASPNSGGSRIAAISIGYNGVYKSVTIVQTGSTSDYLDLSTTSLTFFKEAASATVAISSNTAWTVTADVDWIDLSISEGINSASLIVTSEENMEEERTGLITFEYEGLTKTISVKQLGIGSEFFQVSQTTFNFTENGGNATIEISTNTSWLASTRESWLTVSKSNGTGNDFVTIKVGVNKEISRSGIVTFTQGTTKIDVTIHQSGVITLATDPYLLNDRDLKLFPNPFAEKLYISFKALKSSDSQISIYNNYGVLIHEYNLKAVQGDNTITFDNTHFENLGVYLIYLKVEGKTDIRKVIRN